MDEFAAAKKLQQQKSDKCEEEEALQCVPNWLIEVLAWINRIEMANSSIPISCLLFHKLCQPKLHGNIQPYIVAKLHFDLETKRLKKCRKLVDIDIPSGEMVKDIPIAKCPPPPYILGFKSISFGFIDADVMEFVKNILPLATSRWLRYQESILSPYLDRDVLAATDDVRQLLTMLTTTSNDNDNIGQKVEWLRWECEGLDLGPQFTLNFPGILDNVQIFCITHSSLDRTFIDIAFKWLIEKVRRIDGKPKILFFGGTLECTTVLLNRIKEDFRISTQPLTFFVLLQDWTCRFKMENNRTGEVLLLVTKDYSDEIDWWYLLRCPKGTENEWKEEGLKLFFNSAAEMDNATMFNVEWERKKIDDVPIKKKKNIFSKCFKK